MAGMGGKRGRGNQVAPKHKVRRDVFDDLLEGIDDEETEVRPAPNQAPAKKVVKRTQPKQASSQEVKEKPVVVENHEVKTNVVKPRLYSYVDSCFGKEECRSFLIESLILDEIAEHGKAKPSIIVTPDLQSTLLSTTISNLTRNSDSGGVRFI